MTVELARMFAACVGAYALVGVGFGLVFVTVGLARVDPAARGAGWGFRIMVFPGAAALWPLLGWRWLRGRTRPPEQWTAHEDVAGEGDA